MSSPTDGGDGDGGRTNRRSFLIGGGVAAVAAAGVAIGIAASGGRKKSSTAATTEPTTEPTTSATPATTEAPSTSAPAPVDTAKGGEPGSTVQFVNWPLYIEGDDGAKSPTLLGFTKATGIKVNYRPEIDGNDTFFTKYEPYLTKKQGIGADIIVLTTWMAARFIERGFVQPLDVSAFPNKANVIDAKADPSWDPGRRFSVPYAIGQTGIAYFPDKVGGRISSISDLLDPRLKNRVSVLDEWRDTVGLFMLDMGFDPSKGDIDQAKLAIDTIKKARDVGQFRKIAGNSYTDDLQTGEVWAAVAWSGDIANLKKDVPGIEFVLPTKGAMSFTDNAMIPIGADNPRGAAMLLNHLYDPAVAGPLYESIVYVPPVKGATKYMTPAGQANTFINPAPDAKLYDFAIISEADDQTLASLFVEATQL